MTRFSKAILFKTNNKQVDDLYFDSDVSLSATALQVGCHWLCGKAKLQEDVFEIIVSRQCMGRVLSYVLTLHWDSISKTVKYFAKTCLQSEYKLHDNTTEYWYISNIFQHFNCIWIHHCFCDWFLLTALVTERSYLGSFIIIISYLWAMSICERGLTQAEGLLNLNSNLCKIYPPENMQYRISKAVYMIGGRCLSDLIISNNPDNMQFCQFQCRDTMDTRRSDNIISWPYKMEILATHLHLIIV